MFTTIDSRLFVDVADTPYKQAQGLMFVKDMPDNKGMLFVFDKSQPLSFWGDNTFIPLDIAFADADGVIQKIAHISPMSKRPVYSDKPCKYAVEANDGYFAKNKIGIGDTVQIDSDHLQGSFVRFVPAPERNIDPFNRTAKLKLNTAQAVPPAVPKPPFTPVSQGDMTDEPVRNDEVQPPQVRLEDLGNISEDDLQEQQDLQQQQQQDQEQPQQRRPDEPQPEEDLRYKQFDSINDAIAAAMQVHQVMTIEYTTKFGKPIGTREIEPYGTYLSHPDNDISRNILVTFDQTVGAYRSFRISNITRYSFADRKYKPRIELVV